jgi:hypothetical protein
MADAQACFGSGLDVHVCLQTLPTSQFHVQNSVTLDTGQAISLCDPNFTTICVLAGTSVKIDMNRGLTGVGPRPIVIISLTTMEIDGRIEVESHTNGGNTGAGAQTGCDVPGNGAGTAGGAGGSFGSQGGNGGGGTASTPMKTTTTLRGGCRGSTGGNAGSKYGDGGGAVYLYAETSITVNGSINASGAGAPGATADNRGAGGGGSGGVIAFDTPLLTFADMAQVFANGGGGGEGSGMGGGEDGRNGTDPADSTAGGDGGTGGATFGGDGGDGAPNTTLDGAAGGGSAGSGGGGGGVGMTFLFGGATAPANGHLSPSFSP